MNTNLVIKLLDTNWYDIVLSASECYTFFPEKKILESRSQLYRKERHAICKGDFVPFN